MVSQQASCRAHERPGHYTPLPWPLPALATAMAPAEMRECRVAACAVWRRVPVERCRPAIVTSRARRDCALLCCDG